jgi:hypothetical protein
MVLFLELMPAIMVDRKQELNMEIMLQALMARKVRR